MPRNYESLPPLDVSQVDFLNTFCHHTSAWSMVHCFILNHWSVIYCIVIYFALCLILLLLIQVQQTLWGRLVVYSSYYENIKGSPAHDSLAIILHTKIRRYSATNYSFMIYVPAKVCKKSLMDPHFQGVPDLDSATSIEIMLCTSNCCVQASCFQQYYSALWKQQYVIVHAAILSADWWTYAGIDICLCNSSIAHALW